MDEKCKELVKDTEGLFDKIIKESSCNEGSLM